MNSLEFALEYINIWLNSFLNYSFSSTDCLRKIQIWFDSIQWWIESNDELNKTMNQIKCPQRKSLSDK